MVPREKNRIGIVIGQLSEGGAERQVTTLIKELHVSTKYEPIVFCLSDYLVPYGEMLLESGIPLYYFKNKAKNVQKLLWLIKQVKDTHCSILYGILNIGNIYGGFASLFNRVPFIASIRSSNSNLPKVIQILSSITCNFAARVIANSPSCINSLRKDLCVNHKRVSLIPNYVDYKEPDYDGVERIRTTLAIPNGDGVIGTVALLKPEKRVEFFVKICLKIIEKIGDKNLSCPHFVWVGDGPENSKLLSLLEAVPLKFRHHFHFVGAQSNIYSWLAVMDIFILTSRYEGLPNALLEAMAAGLPCVATDVPGIKDVLGRSEEGVEIGVLTSSSDPDLFARQVVDLFMDKQRMKSMGAAAQKHVKDMYLLEKMVNLHSKIFDEVISSRGK